MPLSRVILVLALSIAPLTGCGTIRNVEQWKCDNMGLCWFGLRPSNQMQNCPPPAYNVPQGGYAPQITEGPTSY